MAVKQSLLNPDSSAQGPGGPDIATWRDVSDAETCNNTYATVGPMTAILFHSGILTTGTYDLSAIPLSATLRGIEVTVQIFADEITSRFERLVLRDMTTSAEVSEDKEADTAIPTSETAIVFGSPTDLWATGFESVSDLLNIEVAVQVERTGAPNPTVSLDCIIITCFFEDSTTFLAMRAHYRRRRGTSLSLGVGHKRPG